MKKFYKNKNFLSVLFSTVLTFVFVFAVANAATTISTSITTGGDLTVSGNSTFGDAATDIGLFTGKLHASTTALFTSGATLYDTVTISGAKGLVLGSDTSDLTGSAGMIYYNSSDKVIKLYDGSNWFTVGTTTSGLTLSGARIQLSTLATQYMTFGTTTQSGLSMMTLEATSTTAIPLTLRAYNAQTADLLRVHNVAGTELFAIDASGNASTTMISTTGNVWVNGYATTTGSNGNFATEGTLTVGGTSAVTGNATFNGNVTLGNAAADVIIVTGNASTTNALTVGGDFYVGGFATTTASNGYFATEGRIGAGTSTPATEIAASASATTTLYLNSSTASRGGCIQLEGANDTVYRAYATTTGPLILEAGACK